MDSYLLFLLLDLLKFLSYLGTGTHFGEYFQVNERYGEYCYPESISEYIGLPVAPR